MQLMFFISLCSMALYGNALKHIGNNTHLSCACFLLRHLGVSLFGDSKCWKSMNETECRQPFLCPSPQRDLLCFCCIASCRSTMKQKGKNPPFLRPFPSTTSGREFLWGNPIGKSMRQTENFANLSGSRRPPRDLVCFC